MSGAKKWIFNTVFLIAVIVLTFYLVFKNQDFTTTVNLISNANLYWCALGLGFVVVFILSESFIMHYLMNTISQKSKLTHCFLYSFVGFFFSSITPSASGGQPAQAYFMRRDNITVSVSAPVLSVITILYKAVLIVIGFAVLALRPAPIMKYIGEYIGWFYLGLFLNVAAVAALILIMFKPNAVRKLSHFVINIYTHIFKKHTGAKLHNAVENGIEKYSNVTDTFKKDKHAIMIAFFMTLIQRCILFSITWLCLKALGFGHISIVLVIILQAMISSAADMIPTPGGVGVSEMLFIKVFSPILNDFTVPAMILSRGISYYSQIVLGAVFTVFSTFVIKDKNID